MKQFSVYKLCDPLDVNETPRYIGITSCKLSKRLAQHLCCKCNPHKFNWINKIRKSGMCPKIILVDTANSWKELCNKEIFYIKYYKDSGINLINISSGGDGAFGVIQSEEHKNSISYKKSKKINCYSLDGKYINTYNRIKDAAIDLEISEQAIKSCVFSKKIGRTNRCSKYLFEKYEGSTEDINAYISPNKVQYTRKVEMLNTEGNLIGRYNSIIEASTLLSIDRSSITAVCRGRRKTAGGFIWRYNSN